MNTSVNLLRWEGWHLIGQYDSDVGSWLLHHDGEARENEYRQYSWPAAGLSRFFDKLRN